MQWLNSSNERGRFYKANKKKMGSNLNKFISNKNEKSPDEIANLI